MRTILDILQYFRNVKAQKQIDKLAKKYKDKKIVIYGAGEYFNILQKNYDLSKLNIVAISDKKFEESKEANSTKFTPLTPEELKEFDYDVILVALLKDVSMCNYLESTLLINTKNENKKTQPIIEPNLSYL